MFASPNLPSAVALDAADGCLDGRYYGTRIGIAQPTTVTAVPAYTTAAAIAPSYQTPTISAYHAQTISATPVTTTIPTTFSSGVYTTSAASSFPVVASSSLPVYSAAPAPVLSTSLVSAPATCTVPVARQAVVVPTCQIATVVPRATTPVVMVQQQPEVRVIESPPEVRYIQSPPEIRYIEGPPAPHPAPEPKDMGLAARLHALESEAMSLRAKWSAKQEVRTSTRVAETYKVKDFETAAKLAVMDGTDDGLYNGLPIEVEGQGLYRDLVRAGRRPTGNIHSLTGRPASITRQTETYKVANFELAEKLSKMDGTNDGKYNGLPIEVVGQGLYTDLLRAGRRPGGYHH